MNEEILNQLGLPNEDEEETTSKSEDKDKEKKKPSKKTIEDDAILSMIANGDNTKGMFEPDEDEVVDKDKNEKLHQEVDEDAKIKIRGDAKPSDKYAEKFQEDMMKNPQDYMVNTPKGKMTLKEAREKGYDPITKRFRKQTNSKREQELLAQLNEKDRAAIERMMDPSQVGLAPADAQALGLKPDSKMIRQSEGAQPAMPIPSAPTAQIPQAPATQPSAQAAPANQTNADILSLFGGNA